ncbi:hypothetical protein GCM10009414_27110 [Tatumella terrea]|uniref:hypothetical protein n=1 Tax=Tatumella terrea TaxID=419007 RepID=UPI0031DDB26C
MNIFIIQKNPNPLKAAELMMVCNDTNGYREAGFTMKRARKKTTEMPGRDKRAFLLVKGHKM